MTFSGVIRLVAVMFLLCVLPCDAYSQIEENIGRVELQQQDTLQTNDGGRKIWDRLKFWKGMHFNINLFKGNKGGKDTAAMAVQKEEVVKGPKMKRQYSVGTNFLGWAYFGTANLEGSISLGKHFSAVVGGRYNSLNFETKAYKEIFHNQVTAYAGVKYWPWFVNSGWWIGIKGQYSDFSTAGIHSSYLREGVAVGGVLHGGYSFMLGKHFNLDIGVGAFGGTYLEYTDLEEPQNKPGMFVKIDNIQVSLTYFF